MIGLQGIRNFITLLLQALSIRSACMHCVAGVNRHGCLGIWGRTCFLWRGGVHPVAASAGPVPFRPLGPPLSIHPPSPAEPKTCGAAHQRLHHEDTNSGSESESSSNWYVQLHHPMACIVRLQQGNNIRVPLLDICDAPA